MRHVVLRHVALAVLVAGVWTPSWSVAAQTARDATAAPRPTGTASLSGRVITMEGGLAAPVRRARVTLDTEGLTQALVTDTDTEGRYRFDALPAGSFRAAAEKAGFVAASMGLPYGVAPPKSIDLKAGQAATADLIMERGAALEGRIANTTGDPAINVVVSAVRLAYGSTGRRPIVVRQVRTDDAGRFRVHSLPPGDYLVDVALDPLQGYSEPLAPGEKAPGFARTYFPGTARLDDARTITVATGEEARNLDFTVTFLPMATVSGRVVDASGKVLTANYALRLQALGGLPGDVRALMDQSGQFTFGSVPPGEYWLLSAAVPAAGAEPEFAAMRVSLAGQDLRDLRVVLAKAAVVSGRIEAEGTSAPVPPGLQLVAHPTTFEVPAAPGTPPAPVAVAADGGVTMTGFFGPRLLRLSRLPPGWALKGIWLDGVEVTDVTTEFGAAAAPRSLRVVVTKATGVVTGAVEASGAPLAGTRVVVFSNDERRWGTKSRFIKSVLPAADGRYTIDGLLPGDYAIVAVPFMNEGFWEDPEVLRALKPAASQITVGAQEEVRVSLKVKRLP